jgi:CBS domain-containing protein
MASNPALRLSLAGWKEKFTHIVSHPTPESMLQSSIFFDLRAIDGQAAFAQQLHQHLLPLTRHNTLFQFHLAQNALRDRAPLGFFKGFVLTQEGEQQPGCDLKKNGTSLITDIARVTAYAQGINEVNTRQRLQALNRANAMDEDLAQNLLDAFDLIAQLRWEKHQQDIHAQRPLSNILEPASLHNLQRQQLRDSFEVINKAQAMVRFRFLRGL